MDAEQSSAPVSVRWFSWGLVVVRVVMGAFFLMEAVHQITSGYIGGDDLAVKLQKALDNNDILPPYEYFLEHVALKIDDPLTVLVIVGEVAVGVGLMLGLVTRLTAAVAVFMNVNFLLMNGPDPGSGGIDAVFIVGEIVLFAFAARQAVSADRVLARMGVSVSLMSGAVEQRVA